MKRILALTGISAIYTVVFQMFYNWIRYATPWPYEDLTNFFTSSLANFIPFWVLCVLVWCIVWHIPVSGKTWLKIGVDLILTSLALIAENLALDAIFYGVEWGGTVFNAIFIFLGVNIYYYVTKYTESLRMEAMAREQMLHYRYDALKAHVNPHFLFNSLNILSSLIVIDIESSRKFIISLSRLYRYIMSKENCDSVKVDEEISFLRNYIEVLQIRYGGNLNVSLKIADGVEDRKIIPYTMQLLMENVIKHNIISAHAPMQVDITVGEDGITFDNIINPKESESVSHIGIRYLTKLYELNGRSFTAVKEGNLFKIKLQYI